MFTGFLVDVFRRCGRSDAIVWKGQVFDYDALLEAVCAERERIATSGIQPGAVVAVLADFSPRAVALFLALIENRNIIVPLTDAVECKREEFVDVAQVEVLIRLTDQDDYKTTVRHDTADHQFYRTLRELGHPGLVLFSSGSTGESKAAVHDLAKLLEKFQQPRHCLRTIAFLLYDHIGGLNTLLYTLSNGGCLVTVEARDPDSVLQAIEDHGVELLPTSPTFLNMVLLSEAHKRYDLSSLRTITYGTEPMPDSTLRRVHEVLPHVRLQQTYGLSEVGILRSKSRSSNSLWMKVGGEGFETRVVDGILHVKARSAMLGYLNAPSPFTEDGWFVTGDSVVQDGQYIRILGRQSEMINVGGQKVFPAEAEDVIQQCDNVLDVTVHGESNPLVGQIVCATVTLEHAEDPRRFTVRLKQFCRQHLEEYKVPARVNIVDHVQHGSRFKRLRQRTS